MFDPTIFDNLKVVLEGALYELDSDKRILVIGREDLVDLAGMSRTFRMHVQVPAGICKGELELTSGILDFAGELRRLRLADEVPGSQLKITYRLDEQMALHHQGIDLHMQEVWGEVADVVHERITVLLPHAEEGRVGQYRITLSFRGKIDEDNIEDIEPLLEQLVTTLGVLEKFGETSA